ncbi:hypothetical protein CEXT_291771 [Caerostris extrusa]|uniref:Uncharacterized protein n=1 Tax=Caerostris extrusa TaxID=172846 RepID=A0AAV4YBM4_CAEEX|nr:hypothetical protein CEXT_291771 [Caerostris extrusa]
MAPHYLRDPLRRGAVSILGSDCHGVPSLEPLNGVQEEGRLRERADARERRQPEPDRLQEGEPPSRFLRLPSPMRAAPTRWKKKIGAWEPAALHGLRHLHREILFGFWCREKQLIQMYESASVTAVFCLQ